MQPDPKPPRDSEPVVQVETRDETIERIGRDEIGAESQTQPDGADPTSRRRLGRRSLIRAYVIGFAVAVPVALIAWWAGTGIGLAIGLAAAVLIGSGVLTALVNAMREDGRIETAVEHANTPDSNR